MHKTKIIQILAIFTLVLITQVSYATIRTFGWDHDTLKNKADYVLIAYPIATHETKEIMQLPETHKKINMVGVETIFSVSAVFKGELSEKKITLHHYKLQEKVHELLDSSEKPLFVSFDIPKEDQYPKYEYLLFLIKDKDGKLAPVSGQFNAAISIKRLPDLANYK